MINYNYLSGPIIWQDFYDHNMYCVVMLPLETDTLAFIVFYCLSQVAFERDTK